MFVSQDRNRITQLDGLRGIAIILVILNHLRLDLLYEYTPTFFHPVLQTLTANGKVGVALLFMLSGFLMMSLYPVVELKLNFWQKRYERIFPAFVVMCLTLLLTRFFWNSLSTVGILFLVLSLVAIFGYGWQKLYKRVSSSELKLIFLGFLVFQAIVAGGYIFLQNLVEPSIFYNFWPRWLQALIQFVVNMTMTLPFGVYVGQLDGVYWSLLTEIFFYLLYPVLFLPIFSALQQSKAKSKLFWSLVLLTTLIPLLVGLKLLFEHFLGFGILQVQFVVYFVMGMIICLVRDHPFVKNFWKWTGRWSPVLLVSFGLIGILSLPLLRKIIYTGYLAESLIWALPLSLVLILSLDNKVTAWTSLLNRTWLVKLGVYSYSLYLTHTIAIEMFVKSGQPTTLLQMFFVAFLAIFTTGVLSYLLHHLVEQTYFIRKKTLAAQKMPTKIENKPRQSAKAAKFYWLPIAMSFFILFAIWYSFRLPVSLSSLVQNHQLANFPETSIITDQPLIIPFTATQDNLGLLFLDIKRFSAEELETMTAARGGNDTSSLLVSIFDEEGREIATNRYLLQHLTTNAFSVVGLPLQTSSALKNYSLSLRIEDINASQVIALVNTQFPLRTVYLSDKRSLFSNPKLMFQLAISKISQPFIEHAAKQIIWLSLPFVLSLYGLVLTPYLLKNKQFV